MVGESGCQPLKGKKKVRIVVDKSSQIWRKKKFPRHLGIKKRERKRWRKKKKEEEDEEGENASGTIPISSLPAHILAEVAEGSGSPAM